MILHSLVYAKCKFFSQVGYLGPIRFWNTNHAFLMSAADTVLVHVLPLSINWSLDWYSHNFYTFSLLMIPMYFIE